MSYPTDLAGRLAKREMIRQQKLAEAARIGLTIACRDQGYRHSTCLGAAVCLCPCHDPAEDA